MSARLEAYDHGIGSRQVSVSLTLYGAEGGRAKVAAPLTLEDATTLRDELAEAIRRAEFVPRRRPEPPEEER